MRKLRILWLMSVLNLCFTHGNAQAGQFTILGLDKFSPESQKKLSEWLILSREATANTFGEYGFDIQIKVHKRKASEPVPWANTWRGRSETLHFYVSPRFTKQRFIQDWTSYHEFSHLALPYLSEPGRWFAEGFASFMQYQIMHRSKILRGNPNKRYRSKLSPYLTRLRGSQPPVTQFKQLLAQRDYPPAYWGGAWFFVLADNQLKKQGSSVVSITREYLACCRTSQGSIDEVVASWDTLAPQPIFSHLLKQFRQQDGKDIFPSSL